MNFSLVCISASPVPYTTPVLNALAQRLKLHVIYMCEENRINRFLDTWGNSPRFDYSFHWSRTLNSERIGLQTHFSVGVSRRLAKLQPDAVLVVSWKPVAFEPWLWCRWSGRATVMWSESTKFSGMLRGPISTRIRRGVVRNIDGFVTNGSQATAYLQMLGVPLTKIVTSMLPTGATPVAQGSIDRNGDSRATRFLYVGRLMPQKHPVELIHAFATVRDTLPEATLTLVGKGELERDVRNAALHTPGVHYRGYAEGDELASIYSQSDILVLPAEKEVWGLVVNEALAHGLFVVATDEVGSAYDLLDGGSGIVFPAHDLATLGPTLIEAATTADLSATARHARAAAVAQCTPERFASDISSAAGRAIALRAGRSTTR